MAVIVSGLIGVIKMPLVTRELHTSRLTKTSLPVEAGANISDHAQPQPRTIELTGVIGTRVGQSRSILDNNRAAYTALVALQRAAIPFPVISGLNVYANMLIVSLEMEYSADAGENTPFTAILEETPMVTLGVDVQAGVALAAQAALIVAAIQTEKKAAARAAPLAATGQKTATAATLDTTTQAGRDNTALLESVQL